MGGMAYTLFQVSLPSSSCVQDLQQGRVCSARSPYSCLYLLVSCLLYTKHFASNTSRSLLTMIHFVCSVTRISLPAGTIAHGMFALLTL